MIEDGLVAGALIRFSCECGAKLTARPEKVGQRFNCPKCQRTLYVPDPGHSFGEIPANEVELLSPFPGKGNKNTSTSRLRTVAILFCSLFGGCCLLSGIGAIIGPPPNHNDLPQRPTARSNAVASWRGSGIKNTESFDVTQREWAIDWTFKDESASGSFLSIMVMDENDDLVDLVANVANQASVQDRSVIRGRGRHYLKINSANGQWAITVYDGVPD